MERGILSKEDEVRALLEGRKTQLRRPVKCQPAFFEPDSVWSHHEDGHGGAGWYVHSGEYPDEGSEFYHCPYGTAGDLLYVREKFTYPAMEKGWMKRGGCKPVVMFGTAIQETIDSYHFERWRSSTQMPKWAARIWIEITAVRVERVQDITAVNARAEGAPYKDIGPASDMAAIDHFAWGWRQIYDNKLDLGWDYNPWVWVVDFRRVER